MRLLAGCFGSFTGIVTDRRADGAQKQCQAWAFAEVLVTPTLP
jgi:hypothetical protein